jgi:rhodanese-related sulfurtransferase
MIYYFYTDAIRSSGIKHVLLDVREPTELEICSLPPTCPPTSQKNVAYSGMDSEMTMMGLEDWFLSISSTSTKEEESPLMIPVYVVCRRGNDS